MWRDGRLFIIDFQDARMGPDTYDLVSLLRDSYVDIGEDALEDYIAYFLAFRGGTPSSEERREFRRRFDLMALQRNLKALGHVRLSDGGAPEPGVHPVHAAHAALRADQPGEVPALCRPARRAGPLRGGAARLIARGMG